MDKAWVQEKEAQRAEEIRLTKETIRRKILDAGLQEYVDVLLAGVDKSFDLHVSFLCGSIEILDAIKKKTTGNKELFASIIEKYCLFEHSIREELEKLFQLKYSFQQFSDSDLVEFDGDIIITDPCYVMRDDAEDDWEKCSCGENMDELGIHHFMSRSTIIGDWSCTVYNTDNHRKIGEFCADAGMVSVLLLNEVLQYNPSFDYHINRKWTTALIKNFKGTVQFVVHEVHFEYNGEDHVGYEVEVVGHGVNKKTGKPFNFSSRQTGL